MQQVTEVRNKHIDANRKATKLKNEKSKNWELFFYSREMIYCMLSDQIYGIMTNIDQYNLHQAIRWVKDKHIHQKEEKDTSKFRSSYINKIADNCTRMKSQLLARFNWKHVPPLPPTYVNMYIISKTAKLLWVKE